MLIVRVLPWQRNICFFQFLNEMVYVFLCDIKYTWQGCGLVFAVSFCDNCFPLCTHFKSSSAKNSQPLVLLCQWFFYVKFKCTMFWAHASHHTCEHIPVTLFLSNFLVAPLKAQELLPRQKNFEHHLVCAKNYKNSGPPLTESDGPYIFFGPPTSICGPVAPPCKERHKPKAVSFLHFRDATPPPRGALPKKLQRFHGGFSFHQTTARFSGKITKSACPTSENKSRSYFWHTHYYFVHLFLRENRETKKKKNKQKQWNGLSLTFPFIYATPNKIALRHSGMPVLLNKSQFWESTAARKKESKKKKKKRYKITQQEQRTASFWLPPSSVPSVLTRDNQSALFNRSR